jgi:predicted DNA-binding transcriptional regulator AlpA
VATVGQDSRKGDKTIEGKPSLPALIGSDDICQAAGISRRTLRRLVSSGQFPGGLKIGAKRVWHPDELDLYLRQASRDGKRTKTIRR